MKRVLLQYVLAAGALSPLAAQEAARAADSATTQFDAGGIRVIHRPSGSDIVVANLYLLGGVRQTTFENAGIELLLLDATERGTRTYSKERLRRAMSRLGTSILLDAEHDWTSIGVRATRATFDSTWAIFSSRLMEPTLELSEVELVRQQFLLGVKQRQDSPDALAEYLADSLAYAGHPYAVPPAGTERSLAAISLADLKKYHAEQMVKSRMLLVVVGDVPREKITRMVSQTLGKLHAGSYLWTLPDTLPRRRATAFGVQRELPTNYILGRYAGPRAGTKDYYALRIASAVLSGQLFGEIRSRRNLTYAVDAPFIDRGVSGGGLYVTTVSPGITVDIMRQQLAAVRTSNVDEEALGRLIHQFLTQFFMDNETNAQQADFLAKSYLFEGDIKAVGHFEEQLRAITPDDIRRVAQRWMRDVQWAYIGDVSKLPKGSMERW
ncbi:MAG: M16 family metallopeptidase [Gemmatimonadaceae bacterium]